MHARSWIGTVESERLLVRRDRDHDERVFAHRVAPAANARRPTANGQAKGIRWAGDYELPE